MTCHSRPPRPSRVLFRPLRAPAHAGAVLRRVRAARCRSSPRAAGRCAVRRCPGRRTGGGLPVRDLGLGHGRADADCQHRIKCHRAHRPPASGAAAPDGAGCPPAGARPQRRADRRRRRSDLGLHPRHQLEPREGPDRRHRRQRPLDPEPCLRLQPVADLRPLADRGAARAPERPLRSRRHRRRDLRRDEARRGTGPGDGDRRRRLVRHLQPVRQHLRLGGHLRLLGVGRPHPAIRRPGHAVRIAASRGAVADRLHRHQDGLDQARGATHRRVPPQLRAALLRQHLSRPGRRRLPVRAAAVP